MTAFTRRRASAAAVVLLLVGGVVWCAQAIRKAERPSGDDLVSYLASSTALYSGSDPYNTGSQFPYIYPLLLATLIRPLAELPPRTVAVLWFMLSSVCLLYVVNAAARCPGRARTFGVLALAGVVAVFGDVIQNELLNGQVNLLGAGAGRGLSAIGEQTTCKRPLCLVLRSRSNSRLRCCSSTGASRAASSMPSRLCSGRQSLCLRPGS